MTTAADLCPCGHTKGAHNDGSFREGRPDSGCTIGECPCVAFWVNPAKVVPWWADERFEVGVGPVEIHSDADIAYAEITGNYPERGDGG